jgi:hypothetical protein
MNARRILLLICAFGLGPAATMAMADSPPIRIAVFPFELQDSSAAGGVVDPDDRDRQYLTESTAMAEKMLAAAGKYQLVDASSADIAASAPHGLRNCITCAAALARDLGAAQALVGMINRIGRSEYTVVISIIDARTAAAASSGFSNLRFGARDSWPRGVKSLLSRHVRKNNP